MALPTEIKPPSFVVVISFFVFLKSSSFLFSSKNGIVLLYVGSALCVCCLGNSWWLFGAAIIGREWEFQGSVPKVWGWAEKCNLRIELSKVWACTVPGTDYFWVRKLFFFCWSCLTVLTSLFASELGFQKENEQLKSEVTEKRQSEQLAGYQVLNKLSGKTVTNSRVLLFLWHQNMGLSGIAGGKTKLKPGDELAVAKHRGNKTVSATISWTTAAEPYGALYWFEPTIPLRSTNKLYPLKHSYFAVDTVFLAVISEETVDLYNLEPVPWDSAPINPGGHFNTLTHSYIVPVDGYYQYVQWRPTEILFSCQLLIPAYVRREHQEIPSPFGFISQRKLLFVSGSQQTKKGMNIMDLSSFGWMVLEWVMLMNMPKAATQTHRAQAPSTCT